MSNPANSPPAATAANPSIVRLPMVMCSRPTSPPRLDARMADSPPTLSNRDPTFEIRVVVYVDPCLLGGKKGE